MSDQIDVRTVAPQERHPFIFARFDALAAGQAIELVNDHDPLPLYGQFSALRTGKFTWDYVQQGPDVWRVRIAKKASHGGCCGSCG